MRILFVTDAWAPQVSGAARSSAALVAHARARGHDATVLEPGLFATVPCPTEPGVRLAAFAGPHVARVLDSSEPHAVHLMTEGPLGIAARRACLRRGLPFTTSFCTRFPEYLRKRIGLPLEWGYRALRKFHSSAARTFVSTPSLLEELRARGFGNLAVVPRGVDAGFFRPCGKAALDHLPRPVFLAVGRVAPEKNLAAFLALDLPGTKVVAGDGPGRAALQRRFPAAVFLGALRGERLARVYSAADALVFPSRTDTFGLAMIEALACGVPVAAFPVRGPLDVLGASGAGAMDEDLGAACRRALAIPAAACLEHARRFTWQRAGNAFLELLAWRGEAERAA